MPKRQMYGRAATGKCVAGLVLLVLPSECASSAPASVWIMQPIRVVVGWVVPDRRAGRCGDPWSADRSRASMRFTVSGGALRHRNVRILLFGQVVDDFGNAMFPIALVGLVAGRGPALLGLLLGVRGITTAVFGLPVGVWISRFKRTTVLIVCEVAELLIVIAYAFGPSSPSALIVLAALSGAFGAAANPATGSLLPLVVPEEDLQQANAFRAMASRTAFIAGPAFGGFLLAATRPSMVFLVDAATFGAGILAFALVSEPRAPRAPGSASFCRDFRLGLSEVRQRRWVLAIIAIATAQAPLTIAPGFTLLPIVAAHSYGRSVYGLAMSCMAAGELAGAAVAARWTPRRPGLVSLAGCLPYPLVLLCLAGSSPVGEILAGYILVGIGFMMFGVYWYTALQKSIAPDRLGVVFSIDQVGSFGLQPFGYALAGVLAASLGARKVLIGAGLFGLVTTLIPLAVPGVPGLADPERQQAASLRAHDHRQNLQ
jgi:predicted MFS family arabinose efflux permease